MATKRTKAESPAPKETPTAMRRFKVAPEFGELTSLHHGNDHYPITDGVVDLPKGQTWYRFMIDGGLLTPGE